MAKYRACTVWRRRSNRGIKTPEKRVGSIKRPPERVLLSRPLQNKYKESGKKGQTVSAYSQLPETNDIQFARAVSEIQSEVRRDTCSS